MLLTFRLFLLAAGLIIVALAVTARGLVPDPEVRTHIGEPPSVSRSLVQQAIVPPATFVQSAADSAGRAEDAAAGSEASDPALAVAVQAFRFDHAAGGAFRPDRRSCRSDGGGNAGAGLGARERCCTAAERAGP